MAEGVTITSNGASLKDLLKESYLEECSDVEKYLTLAEKLEKECPEERYASIIRNIASDEYEHKHYLMCIMEDMDAFMPDDIRKAMEAADTAFRKSK